jgi:hypothetical protein
MVAIKHGSQHEKIKRAITNSYINFESNYKRYNEFKKSLFETTLTEAQKTFCRNNGRPIIEFNLGDANASRLIGEFSKNTPSVECRKAGTQNVPPQIIDIAEGHLRHIIYEANKKFNFSIGMYTNMLAGGFAYGKVFTDYKAPMSFEQIIGFRQVFNNTLCGHDPLARAPHKADGGYMFEIYPLREEDYKSQFPGAPIKEIAFTRELGGFNWSYKDAENEGIILVADFYQKKKKKVKIVQLSDGRVIEEEKYERLEAMWKEHGIIEQFPIAVNSRKTEIEKIERFIINEEEVIKHQDTDFNYYPLVFFNGKSEELANDTGTMTYQFTVPYTYYNQGVQSLKNFSGQTLANGLENMIQHKWIVKKEALPQETDYLTAIFNPQKPNTVVVNAFNENNPEQPIPDPIREVQPVPLPPEVIATFTACDQLSQVILGTYDAALGINTNQLSGVAFQEAATQSNAVAMPYTTGYLQGLTQMCCVALDLMPRYLFNHKELPSINKKGKTDYLQVNTSPENTIDYDRDSLHVEVYAGVSYEIQKNQALQQIIAMMQASKAFDQFMNTDGLMILIKNLTIHGQDHLEEVAEQYMQKMQQQQAQAAQMQEKAMQNDPRVITAKAKVMEVQNKDKQNQFENQLRVAEVSIDKQRADTDGIVAMAQVNQEQINSAVQIEKAQTEREVHALDAAAKLADSDHAKNMDHHESIRKTVELHHAMKQAEKEVNSEKVED